MPPSKMKVAAKKRAAARKTASATNAEDVKDELNDPNLDHNYGKKADKGDTENADDSGDSALPPAPKRSKNELYVPKRILECPVCLEVPRGKIFVCEETHPVCEPCYIKMEANRVNGHNGMAVPMECPVAKCPFPQNIRRLWLAEQLVEESGFEFDCKYSAHGCTTTSVSKDVERHEATCRYREMPCFGKNCNERISRFNLAAHYKEKHSDQITRDLCLGHLYDKGKSGVEANTNSYEFWPHRQMTFTVGNDTLNGYSFCALNKSYALFAVKIDTENPQFKDHLCKISLDLPGYGTLQYQGKMHDLEDAWPMLLDEKQFGLVVPMNTVKRLSVDGKINVYAKFSLV